MSSFKRLALAAAVAFASLMPLSAQTRYFTGADLQAVIDRLDVRDLHGRRWTAADLRGRVTLVEFWATWCAPCLAEMPRLRRLRESHGPAQFEVLAVSLDSLPRRDFTAWINRQGVQWPQVFDGRAFNGSTARAFGVQALPASLLLDQRGRIVAANLRGGPLERAVGALVQRTSTNSFDAALVPMVIR